MQVMSDGKIKSGWLPESYVMWMEEGDEMCEEIHAYVLGEEGREGGGREEGKERGEREGGRRVGVVKLTKAKVYKSFS